MVKKFLDIVKFVFFMLILPFLFIVTISFAQEAARLPSAYVSYFVWGGLAYLLIHLFLFEPLVIHESAQRITGSIFRTFATVAQIATNALAIYTLLILIVYYCSSRMLKNSEFHYYFMFLTSSSFLIHMVFTSRALKQSDDSVLKANYFLSLSLIYLFNLFVIAGMFHLIHPKFLFSEFFEMVTSMSAEFYVSVFRQLFMP